VALDRFLSCQYGSIRRKTNLRRSGARVEDARQTWRPPGRSSKDTLNLNLVTSDVAARHGRRFLQCLFASIRNEVSLAVLYFHLDGIERHRNIFFSDSKNPADAQNDSGYLASLVK
jgi:hypothetical protein